MAKGKRLRRPREIAGPPGPPGPTGLPGPTGKKDATAPETDRTALLVEVNGHIEAIYKELEVQLKRMSQIQRQVDELREKVQKFSE